MSCLLVIKKIYRAIKKIVKKALNKDLMTQETYGDEFVEKESRSYLKLCERYTGAHIYSDIPSNISYPVVSRAREMFMESLLRSKRYTFEDILVLKNPYHYAPLTALVLFYTKDKCKALFKVKGQCEADDISGQTGFNHYHRVPIIGLYPGKENEVELMLLDEDDQEVKRRTVKIKTSQLPVMFRENAVCSEVHKHEFLYGMTLVYGSDKNIYPYAFDRSGQIRYYFKKVPKVYGFQSISKGKVLFLDRRVCRPSYTNPSAVQMYEVDFMGRFHKIFYYEKGFHHDFQEVSLGGNIVTSSSSMDNSLEDAVIEVNRKNGKIVRTMNLKDKFDTTYQDMIDWAHINTVQLNKKESTLLLCLRNFHSVVKLDWKSGEILWILCNPLFWKDSSLMDKVLKPVDENMPWFYQAHASYFLEDDLDGNPDTKHLIIYDNHWQKRRKVSFYDDDPNSHVRIYTINEKEQTVELFKDYTCQKSKIRSNAVLHKKENRVMAMSGCLEPQLPGRGGMITEYDYETGEVLNQLITKYSYYRAYEFLPDYQTLSESMDTEGEYLLGEIDQMEEIKVPDISKCEKMPAIKLQLNSEEERRDRLKKLVAENPEVEIDPEQDIARISINRVEDMLYIKQVDHLIDEVILVGNKFSYRKDLSETEQVYPQSFRRTEYSVPVSLAILKEDKYQIYLKCAGKLYRYGKEIQITWKGL